MKYHNKKIEYKDITFDSTAERDYYIILSEKAEKGQIKALERQVKYNLIPKNKYFRALDYIADFTYYDNEDNFHVVDIKSSATAKDDLFIAKRKMMYHLLQIYVEVIIGKYNRKTKTYEFE